MARARMLAAYRTYAAALRATERQGVPCEIMRTSVGLYVVRPHYTATTAGQGTLTGTDTPTIRQGVLAL